MMFRYGPETITIRVGEGRYTRDFLVYSDLISWTSEFINKALKGDWQESEERLVKLPDFSPEVFQVYHVWVLSGRLHSRNGDKDFADVYLDLNVPKDLENYEGSLWWEMEMLSNLSHLGHYLLDTEFTDTVSDAIVQCTIELQVGKCAFPVAKGPGMIAKIPESSPTRALIFDLVAWTTDESQMRGICADLRKNCTEEDHLDFMTGIAIAMASRLTSSTPPPMSPLEAWESPDEACKYHSHVKKEEGCYRNRSF
jgi:hypothetical protein